MVRWLLAASVLVLVPRAAPGEEQIPAAVEEARVKASQGDPTGAIRDLERLLGDPGAPDVARELLGALYLSADRPGDALEVLLPLTEGDAADPVVLFNVARALRALGRTWEGITYLERSARLAPRSRAAVQLARLRARAGKHDEVARLLEPMAGGAVAELMECEDPALALEVATSYAGALVEIGERQKALPHLERATRLAPERPEVWQRLGKLLVDLGRPDDAYAALARAQSLSERQLEEERVRAQRSGDDP